MKITVFYYDHGDDIRWKHLEVSSLDENEIIAELEKSLEKSNDDSDYDFNYIVNVFEGHCVLLRMN